MYTETEYPQNQHIFIKARLSYLEFVNRKPVTVQKEQAQKCHPLTQIHPPWHFMEDQKNTVSG
jgi:hypothetical protein